MFNEESEQKFYQTTWFKVAATFVMVSAIISPTEDDVKDVETPPAIESAQEEEVKEVKEEKEEVVVEQKVEEVQEELENDQESVDYANFLTGHAGKMTNHFNDLTRLAETPFISDQWLSEILALTSDLRNSAQEALDYPRPAGKMSDTYDLYSIAMVKYQESMSVLEQGIIEVNPDKINRATALMGEGNEFLDLATYSTLQNKRN